MVTTQIQNVMSITLSIRDKTNLRVQDTQLRYFTAVQSGQFYLKRPLHQKWQHIRRWSCEKFAKSWYCFSSENSQIWSKTCRTRAGMFELPSTKPSVTIIWEKLQPPFAWHAKNMAQTSGFAFILDATLWPVEMQMVAKIIQLHIFKPFHPIPFR